MEGQVRLVWKSQRDCCIRTEIDADDLAAQRMVTFPTCLFPAITLVRSGALK